MSREEYFHIADSDDGYVSELVRGMVARDPGIAWEHGHLQGKLFRYLDEWMERFGQGMVSVDCGCILTEDPEVLPGFSLEMGVLFGGEEEEKEKRLCLISQVLVSALS